MEMPSCNFCMIIIGIPLNTKYNRKMQLMIEMKYMIHIMI